MRCAGCVMGGPARCGTRQCPPSYEKHDMNVRTTAFYREGKIYTYNTFSDFEGSFLDLRPFHHYPICDLCEPQTLHKFLSGTR